MTLVLEATPSSGGPRCLRSRGSRGSRGAESVLVSLEPFLSVSASFVVSVKGATWPGTFVGVESAGAASVSSTWSAPSPPSPCLMLVTDRVRCRGSKHTARPPRPVRPPRPRPRPRPRVDVRRRFSLPVPSAPLPAPSAWASGVRASWIETLRSRTALPLSSAMARSASEGVERATKA
jgi:hypothetical protein